MVVEQRIFPHQKHAFLELSQSFTLAGVTSEKHLSSYFKEHKKLGSKDRKRISKWYYSFVKNNTLTQAVFGECSDSNFEDVVTFLEEIDNASAEQKEVLIEELAKTKELSDTDLLYSMPKWILDKWEAQENIDSTKLALFALCPSKTFIRFNEILCNEDIITDCIADPVLEIKWDENLEVYFSTAKNLEKSEAFLNGYFEIQDYGSQQIGLFTQAKPNEQIIDACCGAGGKGLQLASQMENLGKIWSLDIRAKALDKYYERASRAGSEINELFEIPENPEDVDFPFLADCVLIDAPCTGSGVFSRNPDRKFRLKESDLESLVKLQARMLASYSVWTKPGARLVYATCSTFIEENQEQIQKFLKEHKEFRLDEEKLILPNEYHNGFYMARMIKEEAA